VLTASAGTYSDGAGPTGLTLLATLRDVDGRGPDVPWTLSLSDVIGPLDVSASYAVSGDGSFEVWTFPTIATSPAHEYLLQLTSPTGTTATAQVFVGNGGLDDPEPTLSADGAMLSWAAPVGAQTFSCDVTSGGESQLTTAGPSAQCDVSALPPGAYLATVEAFSTDVSALRQDPAQTPRLPELDVSAGRLAFTRSDGSAPTLTFSVAGGRFDYGAGDPGLALWLSLRQPDGGVSPEAWTVNVVGPGIPTEAPLELTYPANTPQTALWAYDVSLAEGLYSLTASADGGTPPLSTQFRVPAQTPMAPPLDVTATAAPSGGASVQWTAAPDAGSYFVGVWNRATGVFTAGQWVTSSPTTFASQTFAASTDYDVYVTAATADLTAPPVPHADFQASENTYSPAGFTGL
jgi:hypothetical protein